ADDTGRDLGVGERRVGDARRRHAAVSCDHEPHGHPALELRVLAEAVLVAEPEAAEVLAHDPLDGLGRQPSADHRGAHPHLGRRGAVRAGEPAGAEALAVRARGAVSHRADVAEADPFATAGAALADAAQAEPAVRAEALLARIAP